MQNRFEINYLQYKQIYYNHGMDMDIEVEQMNMTVQNIVSDMVMDMVMVVRKFTIFYSHMILNIKLMKLELFILKFM